MAINAGIWIDHHKAIVILLTDDREDTLQIMADQPVLASSAANDFRPKNSYTRNDFVAEDKRERKVMAHLNEYYDRVIACVRDAQAIVILGPGEAKGEFRKRFVRQKRRGHIAEMKTVAKLTDAQIGDYVRQHFQ